MSHQSGPGSTPSAPPFPGSNWPPQQQPQWQQPPTSGPYSFNNNSHGSPPAPSSAPYAQPYAAPTGYSGPPPPAPAGYGAPYSYPPAGYGGPTYAQSPFPPGTDPDIIQAFQTADRDGSGVVDEYELQRVLSTRQPFSLRTVRLMIHMFGTPDSKKIGPREFTVLWKALKDWKSIYERFDKDRSGTIDKGEMREALLSLGYAISPPILDCLLQKYDRTGQAKAMDYDSFVECGLIVKGLTEKFKEQDTQLKGSATLSYQTFMLMVLPFIVA